MFVTRHNAVVERGLLERLWGLYELAYRRTAEESASREMFFRSEFDSAVADPTNRLWVLWSDDEPVAMVLIATDIGSTRYLSGPYFERHFTDHTRRRAVHYVLFIVVHPRYRRQGCADADGSRRARYRGCRRCAVGLRFPEGQPASRPRAAQPCSSSGLANMVASGAPLIPLDVSRYYGIDFAASSAYVESRHHPSSKLRRDVPRAQPGAPVRG